MSKIDDKILDLKNKQKIDLVTNIHQKILKSKTYPKQHLTAFSGLINDPNGFGKVKDEFHIFYQWAPFSPKHEKKHWGHFVTKDFVNFKHLKTFLKPEIEQEKDGCFSGNMGFENEKPYLFYTGNYKFSTNSQNRTAFTIKTSLDNLTNKEVLFEVDKTKYTGHFRDPFLIKKNNDSFLIHGAQTINKEGTISVYKKNNNHFQLHGNLDLELENNGYMLECPSYFKFAQTNLDVFALSIEGVPFFEDFDKKCVFALGKLDIDKLTFKKSTEQVIDYGRDFYAPQILNDNSRTILIAWFGMSEFDDLISFEDGFANALTLPRELKYENGFVYQKPIKELKHLIGKEIKEPTNNFLFKSDNKLDKWYLQIKGDKVASFVISYGDHNFKIDWSKSQNQNLRSTTNKKINPYREIKIDEFINLEIWVDKTFWEIFVNSGQYVFTQRVDIGEIQSINTNLEHQMFSLKSIKIKGWW